MCIVCLVRDIQSYGSAYSFTRLVTHCIHVLCTYKGTWSNISTPQLQVYRGTYNDVVFGINWVDGYIYVRTHHG